jgi:divalent metal cation (Fe/Co/Zn/Cd) transporter
VKHIDSTELTRDRWIIHVAVVVSYFAKAVTKGVAGVILASPPLINDALHGALDIGEHGLIAWVGKHARKQREALYPLGRKPLLDIVGMVIGFSIAGLALKCLKDAIAALWAILDATFGLAARLPSLILEILPSPEPGAGENTIWLVGLIFVACASVSLVIYRIEASLARKHKLKEYLDDALELRQDATLELATGSCILLAWILILTLRHGFGIAGSYMIINAGTQVLVLLFLSGYLAFHAFHAIKENVRNLLHPGLDSETVASLKHHLERSLPAGCALAETGEEGLVAYVSGEVLHVSGVIRIPRLQMASADLIVQHAQHLAVQFLRQFADESNIRFFPSTYEWGPDDAENEWRRIVREVWRVDSVGALWEQFVAFKRGEVSAVSSVKPLDPALDDNTGLLSAWLRASADLFHRGAKAQTTEVSSAMIHRLLLGLPESDPRRLAFRCWQLVRGIMSGDIYSGSVPEEVPEVRELITSTAVPQPGVPLVLLAEAHFALGLLRERQPSFDLESSDRHYRKALSLYLEAGYPLESDRLLNTWGHQKGLLYEVEESLHLLNQSRLMKEVKGDQVGLAFTYGCLGDTHRRAGSCDLAVKAYQSDIDICTRLNLFDAMTSVRCKLSEAHICWGVLSRDGEKIETAIRALRELLNHAREGSQDAYFVRKALAKGLLWKSCRAAGDERTVALKDAEAVLAETNPFSPYTTALWNRLKGRAAYLAAESEAAVDCQTRARDGFGSMSLGVSTRLNSLQSLCCSVEMALCQSGRCPQAMRDACDAVQRFSDNLGGLLGPARERLDEYLSTMRDPKAGRDAFTQASYALLALIEG